MKVKIDLVVTRHQGLIDFLREKGIIDENTKILTHISDPSEVKDKVVLGNLPLHLASMTKMLITPVLNLTPEMRGKDLSKEDVEKVFGGFKAFEVKEVDIEF